MGNTITNDGKCTREIKSRISIAKAAFNKKKTLFTSNWDLRLRKKLVKCHNLSVDLYGAEIWTLQRVGKKLQDNFEMWCWRRIEKIS